MRAVIPVAAEQSRQRGAQLNIETICLLNCELLSFLVYVLRYRQAHRGRGHR